MDPGGQGGEGQGAGLLEMISDIDDAVRLHDVTSIEDPACGKHAAGVSSLHVRGEVALNLPPQILSSKPKLSPLAGN